MLLGREVDLLPGDIMLDGDPAHPPKKGHSPPYFKALLVCGWIKMALGTKVGFGPGHIVLDKDPAPPKKGHNTPHFSARVYCGQMAGWIQMPRGTVLPV